MKLPPEGARWLVSLRWIACAMVFFVIWLTSSILHVVPQPLPLYIVALAMVGYNLAFLWNQSDAAAGEVNAEKNIFLQAVLDLAALTLLVYFSDLPRNPFLFFFLFHMIIASMYLRGWAPLILAAVVTCTVGGIILLEYLQWIPRFAIHFPSDPKPPDWPPQLDPVALAGLFLAFSGALWITVYFTTSIRRYVDRAHAAIRQKEKMLGIGQLVAGIAHQIANPLDGVQNCLRRIGERVKHDAHLTEYVQMMTEALERIERTATRVQAFARPRGITLQSTDVRAAVDATLEMLGTTQRGQRADRARTGRRAAGAGRSLHAPGGALQPLHQRPGRDAPRWNAHAPLLHDGRPRRGPDGFGGRRRERHRRGHSPRRPGEDLRALLHHPGRPRRHRPGARPVPHVDCRDGRPHRGPQRAGPGEHVHRRAPPRGPAGKSRLKEGCARSSDFRVSHAKAQGAKRFGLFWMDIRAILTVL